MKINQIVGNKHLDDNLVRSNYIDIHCHCLPGIDDGPATMPEAISLCRALVDNGISIAVATPHQLGRYSGCNDAEDIRQAVLDLNQELKNKKIELEVVAGAEVRVDEMICQLLGKDNLLTLADGGKFILLEFPHEIFIDITPLLIDLGSMGITAIISHPERHPGLVRKPEVLSKWLRFPAHLQVTAGSLLGDFGKDAEKFAWQLLSSGQVAVVATDCHNLRKRKPRIRAAFERISDRLGKTAAQLVCIENPLKIVKGKDIETPYSLIKDPAGWSLV